MQAIARFAFVSSCNGKIAADPAPKPLGDGDLSDPEVVPVAPTETNEEFLVRTLLQAADDQNSQESGSQATDLEHSQLPNPQRDAPRLFVPWSDVARSVGIPEMQIEPPSNLRSVVSHELLPEQEQKKFRAEHGTTLQAIPTLPEPVEALAPLIIDAICTSGQRGTGEAHSGDPGIHCVFGAWFWGRQWTRFSHAS